MERPDTPFANHWLAYFIVKMAVLAGAAALATKIVGWW
jgi:hypothetical protein